jgi:hypothetical protein
MPDDELNVNVAEPDPPSPLNGLHANPALEMLPAIQRKMIIENHCPVSLLAEWCSRKNGIFSVLFKSKKRFQSSRRCDWFYD